MYCAYGIITLQANKNKQKTTMKIPHKTPHLLRLIGVITLIAAISLQSLLLPSAYAAGQITTRSLTLQANGLNGGSAPGVLVNHLFNFTLPTAGNVGSIKFEYCTTAADVGAQTCQTPTAMDASGASLTSGTGINGMSVGTKTTNSVILTHGAAPIAISANTVAAFQLSNVKNPQAKKADAITNEPNYTFYVRISTYASLDATGTAIDKGTVTASTAAPIYLSGTMPESLIFCTGATVPFKMDTTQMPAVPTTIPDCANATSGEIKFNQLFDPTTTATSTSQMAASTNAGNGYVITVNGSTLMSGTTNSITAMSTAAFPVTGASQFGLNLKANDTTYLASATGGEISPGSVDGSNLRGEAFTGYNVVNKFKFVSGETVADSGFTNGGPGTTVASDGQIYTVTYIANVPGSQPAGDYSTTLTYICTPTY